MHATSSLHSIVTINRSIYACGGCGGGEHLKFFIYICSKEFILKTLQERKQQEVSTSPEVTGEHHVSTHTK